jgi:putative aldouronate transport system permease protein
LFLYSGFCPYSNGPTEISRNNVADVIQATDTLTDQGLRPRTGGGGLIRRMIKFRTLYLMLLPAILFYVLFHYVPMYGVRIAFFEFGIFGIKEFIGLENFRYLFASSRFWNAFWNTLIISGANLALATVMNVGFALLLNEIRRKTLKQIVQTVVYLPHFLSWVVVAAIFTMLLAPQTGILNAAIRKLGGEPVYFLASERWWRPVFLAINRWKETGWGTIIYLAALAGIDPQLYEAARIDGAGRLKQAWYITLPSLQTTILIVFIISLSRVLNIFQPVFVLYNPIVYSVSDVLGTYTYRVGFEQADYDYATAIGLFRSVISFTLVMGANWLSKLIRKESIL